MRLGFPCARHMTSAHLSHTTVTFALATAPNLSHPNSPCVPFPSSTIPTPPQLTMGWFTSTSSSPAPAISSPESSRDGGFIAPDRTARQQCWDGRDSFFKCLDDHGIVDSVKEGEKAEKVCGRELREFERCCASSWVSDGMRGEQMG